MMLNLLKRKQDPRAGLKEVLGDYELPGFPSAVMEVMRALRDPDSTPEDLAASVEADPGLVVRVLKTVNSAAFGLQQGVDNVGHALAMLGRSRLESLVLGLAVRDALPSASVGGFDSARFWSTAARRATLARSLAERLHPATQALSFTAALLQDMAVPVLVAARSDEYGQLLSRWHSCGDAALELLERDAFDWDHAEVGSLMAFQWELPSSLADAVAGHHADGGAEPAVFLVGHLREAEEDAGLERMRRVAGAHGLDAAELGDITQEAFDRAADLAALLK